MKSTIFVGLCLILSVCPQGLAAEKNFILAIDIGHSPRDPGATSSRGRKEFFFNKRIGQELLEKIKKTNGIDAFFVNKGDKQTTLFERIDYANKKSAHLFISLHHDSVQKQFLKKWELDGQEFYHCDLFSGYSIFVSQKNKFFNESLSFAKILGKNLRKKSLSPSMHHAAEIAGENRTLLDENLGVYDFSNLIVLKNAEMPAILLECGILVNRDEEVLLDTKEYRAKIIDSISNAIYEYAEMRNPSK